MPMQLGSDRMEPLEGTSLLSDAVSHSKAGFGSRPGDATSRHHGRHIRHYGSVRPMPAAAARAAATHGIDVCLVTANVRTLLPWQEDCSYAKNSLCLLRSKVEALEVQFEEHGFDIVGIQEGRSKTTAVINGAKYKMLTVAADEKGSYGNQLWIRYGLNATLLAWRDISNRLMYALLELPNQHVVIALVLHAPHMGIDAKDKDAFWDTVWQTVHTLQAAHPYASLRILADANGRVGSVASTAVGRCQPEIENDGGLRMRLLCEQFDLAIYNTFYPAGYTWTSTYGTRHRIDYVIGGVADMDGIRVCTVADDIDMSLNACVDHSAVSVLQRFEAREANDDTKKLRPFKVNKLNLSDPARVEKFRQLLWMFVFAPGSTVDEQLDQINGYVRGAARSAFGCPKDMPRKKWISQHTWSILRLVAPARRLMNQFRISKNPVVIKGAFMAWAAAAVADCKLRRAGLSTWIAVGIATDAEVEARHLSSVAAYWFKCIKRLQIIIAPSLAEDRKEFLDSVALRLGNAVESNDTRTAYGLARALGADSVSHNSCIKKKDGSLTKSSSEEAVRWEQHYADVFKGNIVTRDQLISNPRRPRCALEDSPITLDVGPAATEASFNKLANNKGVGPDAIPAELLKAGGAPAAIAYSVVNVRVAAEAKWPVDWQGGEIVNVYKRKGDTKDCDSYRGILLEDHSGKALKGILKESIDVRYNDRIPLDQFGATKGRGTDFATHIITSMASIAFMMQWSMFILFIDLVKAFDRIVRELIMGWPDVADSEKVPHLIRLGVDPHTARWMAEYIDQRGCVFQQWGVDSTTLSMTRAMHDGAWFTVRSGTRCITSETGGRQGCKLGSTIFNSGYAVALDMLHWRLAQQGITLRLKLPKSGAFWGCCSDEDADQKDIIDATFVDDECIVILGTTPRVLVRAIDSLLEITTTVFRLLHLEINFSKGKTEAILLFRGKQATSCREQWRQRNGELAIPLDKYGHDGKQLRIVRQYKHLGTVVDAFGVAHANSIERSKAALAAFAPIAMKVFGSELIDQAYKMSFLHSLVLSRQHFNAHIAILKSKDLRVLNSTYMRVLRRISGQMLYSSSADNQTDIQVRRRMGAPSVDCMLMAARLRYASRVVKLSPPSLIAVLHFRREGVQLPWTKVVCDDMRFLAASCSEAPHVDPAIGAQEWASWIVSGSAASAIHKLHFHESALDKSVQHGGTEDVSRALTHTCPLCDARFASQKALRMHERVKHGERAPWNGMVPGSICPACCVDFHLRVRCLNHLGDRRRPACAEWVLTNCKPLPKAKIDKLNLADAAVRSDSRKSGHTTCLSTRPPVQVGKRRR